MLVFVLAFLLPIQAMSQPDGCSAADSLTVRNAHAIAYSDERREIMLFGGADERRVLADLWAWDGEMWNCVSHGGPPPRTFASLAYDAVADLLVLFGGNRVLFGTADDSVTFLDDMWTWDGAEWEEIRTPTPTPRAEASMAYDSSRHRIVLFGGYRNEGNDRLRLGDTWEWDGLKWEQKQIDGPSPRSGAAMTYDSSRRRTVLFGGNSGADDTWEWDGERWEQIASAESEPSFNSAMAFDAARKTVVRFGGWTRDGRVGDTWTYAGNDWTRSSLVGPAARNHASMAFDAVREVIVLFGGHDGERVFGDTWEWDGRAWNQRAKRSPRLRENNGH